MPPPTNLRKLRRLKRLGSEAILLSFITDGVLFVLWSLDKEFTDLAYYGVIIPLLLVSDVVLKALGITCMRGSDIVLRWRYLLAPTRKKRKRAR